MNVKEYISSGNIELYVLGMLDQAEQNELLMLAAKHPEIRKAIDDAENDMLALDNTLGEIPAFAVKEKIFQKITAPKVETNSAAKEIHIAGWQKMLVAASVSIAVITGYLALDYRDKWKKAEFNYISLQEQNQVLADRVERTQLKLDETQYSLEVITEAGTKEIALAGTPYQPAALARVYFSPATQSVFLSVSSLTLPSDQYDFQLWAIVDGKPVDIGLVNMNDAAKLKKMKSVAGASAFAITIEPKGGSINPTLDQMVVFGAV